MRFIGFSSFTWEKLVWCSGQHTSSSPGSTGPSQWCGHFSGASNFGSPEREQWNALKSI